ncbi:MAG TPA: hypothetical protein VGN97_20275 [Mesorhizobium sp.]|jgi:stage V sporulation protein SpoVS|nr:hypothetical protein [Mesorhizobium sp.]
MGNGQDGWGEAAEAGDAAQALEDAADQAIQACGGDPREAVKALIVANGFLEDQLASISYGYARGKVPRRDAG